MIDIGVAILIFGLVRMLISLINWLSPIYLPSRPLLNTTPSVSILIPARNEEHTIELLLQEISRFDYPQLEILVYDDLSTDGTAQNVLNAAKKDNRVRLIKGGKLERGWIGKNYACHQLALQAKGEKLLFLDADVKVQEGIIERSLTYMQRHDLALLSVFPKQIMPSLGSLLSVPLMNWILLSLLPMVLIRLSSWKAFSAANGQFMLFDATIYYSLLPHARCKDNPVEDIAILKYYKAEKQKVATLLGDNAIRCLMYGGLRSAIAGFSKNIFQFFGGSMILTFLFAFIILISPFYLFIVNGNTWGTMYLVIIACNHLFTSLASKQPVLLNLLLIAPQQFVFWKIIVRAWRLHKKKNILWKGRNVYGDS